MQGRGQTAVSSKNSPGPPRLWLPAPRWAATSLPGPWRQEKPLESPLRQLPQSCRATTACRFDAVVASNPHAVRGMVEENGHMRVAHSKDGDRQPPRQLGSRDAASGAEVQLRQKAAVDLANPRRQSNEQRTGAGTGDKSFGGRSPPAGQRRAGRATSSSKHSTVSPRAGSLPDGDISTSLDRMLASFAAASCRAVSDGAAYATDDALVHEARQVNRPDIHCVSFSDAK